MGIPVSLGAVHNLLFLPGIHFLPSVFFSLSLFGRQNYNKKPKRPRNPGKIATWGRNRAVRGQTLSRPAPVPLAWRLALLLLVA